MSTGKEHAPDGEDDAAVAPGDPATSPTAYEVALRKIFYKYYVNDAEAVRFTKADIDSFASDPDVVTANRGKPLSNPPALVYEFRFRRKIPDDIRQYAKPGLEWILNLDGKSRYVLEQGTNPYIYPRPDLIGIPIPEATPEIVARYAKEDEQALLAKIRYNRLVDIFLGVAAYSLQNHLRTSADMGTGGKVRRSQIEIDELYVGVDADGDHYVIPVQAKGGADILSKTQTKQDIAWCREHHPTLKCRPISAQFVDKDGREIVLFLLKEQDGEIKVADERRYVFVPGDDPRLDRK